MYIRRIMVRNFRKFTSPREIKDIADGVTVIAGDNEEGKSTLLNAVHNVIFERHNVSGRPLEAMFPSGSRVRIEIKLDFELDEQLHRLEKTFGHKASAILKNPDGSVVEGHAAEDDLAQLLTFRVPKRGESKHDDRGLLGFFWLKQGHNLDKLNLGEVGREKLRTTLEKEVGDVMGGSLGRKIMQEAREKYGELLTNTGQPRKGGILANAMIEKENKRKSAEELTKKENEYQRDIEELERVRHEQQQIKNGGDLESAQHDLNKANNDHRQVEALQQQSENAGHEIKQAEGELQIAIDRWQQRQRILNEVKNHKDNIEKVKDELNKDTQVDLDGKFKKAEKALEIATQVKKDAELQQKLAKIHQLEQEVANLDKEIVKVGELNEQLLAAQVERDSAKVNQQCFDHLKSISDRVSDLQKEISAAATHVHFFPIEEQTVTSSRGNIAAKQQVEVSKKESFTLDGFGEVEIEPAAANLSDKQRQLDNKKNDLEAALAKVGVEDMDEAASHFNAYQEAKAKIKEAEIRIKSLPHSIDTLRDSHNKKEIELTKLRDNIGDVKATEVIDMHTAEQQLELAAKEVEDARKVLGVVQQNKHERENRRRQDEGALQERTRIINAKKEELKDARRKNSDEKLVAEMNSKEIQLDDKKRSKEKIDAKVAAANPEEISLRIEKAKDTIETIKNKQETLEKKEIEIKGRLSVTGADGIGEGLGGARGAAERADAHHKRVQQEADAWKLLVDTLTESEREAKEMFVEPVLKHILPFLSLLFSQPKLTLDEENMEIKELLRDGKEETFLHLSIGTREQLSILVRLALAVYLKEKGYPSMVILDDALVYADDGRFERMQLALRRAAKSVQIIILTCRSRDWIQSGFPIHNLSDAVITE